jgi:hypothetical protein
MLNWKSVLACAAVAVTVAGCGSSSGGSKIVTQPQPARNVAPSTSATGTGASAALTADELAEALARTASNYAMTYGTNNNGNYGGLTATALNSLDAAIQTGPGDGAPYIDATTGVSVLDGGAGYTVTATSTTGDTFSIGESANGQPTQSCTGAASTACTSSSSNNGGTPSPGATTGTGSTLVRRDA